MLIRGGKRSETRSWRPKEPEPGTAQGWEPGPDQGGADERPGPHDPRISRSGATFAAARRGRARPGLIATPEADRSPTRWSP